MTMQAVKTVLLIESDTEESRLIGKMFGNQGRYSFELTYAGSMQEGESYLADHAVDVVLLDLEMPGTVGQEAVRRIRKAAPRVSIVLLTAPERESAAILAMQEGAQDYLVKGQIETRELMRALRNAIERKVIEEALYKSKERAQVTLDCIGDAVVCTDLAGNISFLNPVAESMTGWSLQEAIGHPLAEILELVDATTRKTIPNPLEKAIAQDRVGGLPANCILIRRDGHELFIEDSVAPIHDRDGMVDGSVIVFRDATVARALAAKIVHLAEHDSLTGLPNRLLLNDRLQQSIAHEQRHKGRIAVLFMDLDGFKHINDSLGHPSGDRLLQSVAMRIEECVRNPDTVSRQGGDEFIVLLHDVTGPADIAVVAGRILQAVEAIHTVDNHDLHVTTSIGVSLYPEDGLTAESLIRNADTAMYQAKENGRNRYRFFKPEMNVRAVERQSIEEDMRHALKHREFSLRYQPIVNIMSSAISGVEALIRWKHPTRGFIPPMEFIPVAEESGLILSIGSWVLREACTQAKAWLDAGLPSLTMAINVSAMQFQSDGFIEGLFAILDETGLDPQSIELEVTESVLMKHAGLAASVLQALRGRGVRVSVDDFGTGYSSLNYLRKFSLDALKIDQSFVREITKGSDDKALVTAIISMARSLRLQVIAEGVETSEELGFLKAEGCDEAQGYLFSRPLPAEQITLLLESRGSLQSMAP